jgi:CTP synthase (UTP-ammonia lyase)
MHPLRIGIIGDFNPGNASHRSTNAALYHSASALAITIEHSWLPTQLLDDIHYDFRLTGYDGLFCAPGSPYISMEGALNGIRFAREQGKPFVGT